MEVPQLWGKLFHQNMLQTISQVGLLAVAQSRQRAVAVAFFRLIRMHILRTLELDAILERLRAVPGANLHLAFLAAIRI